LIALMDERVQQRIGVYGGTFDPIHDGHLKVARATIEAFALDQLLIVPAFVPPHKRTRTISSPYHRFAMLALATADSEVMRLSTIELEAPSHPWTIETLRRLQQENPAAQLFFVMGADSFADVTSWREYERLMGEYHIVVALRPGCESAGEIDAHLSSQLRAQVVDLRGGRLPGEALIREPHIWLTDYIEVDVSASEIRAAAQQGHPIENFVPPVVARYIERHGLYRQGE
jgi:nicotinate-nucleotide adenylyltransferase